MGKLKKIILHIGPEKTGTTTIQSVFLSSRQLLAEQGIFYLSDRGSPAANLTALSLMGPSQLFDNEWVNWDRTDLYWGMAKRQLNSSRLPTALISGEAFAFATDEAITKMRNELVGCEIHLVVTLRPLSEIIPSFWQEQAKRREIVSLENFVELLIADDKSSKVVQRFWRSQRHNELVKRWMHLLGPASTTLIIVAKEEPNNLLRGFSQVLNIDSDLLIEALNSQQKSIDKNRSRTLEEIEILRQIIRLLGQGAKSFFRADNRFMREAFLRKPLESEHKITLSDEHLKVINRIERKIVEELNQLNVHIIGESQLLIAPSRNEMSYEAQHSSLSKDALIDIAGTFSFALFQSFGLRTDGRVDFTAVAKRASLRHLWTLALLNSIRKITPKSLRTMVRHRLPKWM
jgi:hypothetical protein